MTLELTRSTVSGLLERGLAALDPALAADPRIRDKLLTLLDLLLKWNQAYNLTAIKQPAAAVSAHLLDSLSIRPLLHGTRVLDIGTGPGFPGLPLAITTPAKRFYLLDANGKKIAFVRQCVGELALDNVVPVEARVEDWTAPAPFDTIVSRALSELGDFVQVSRKLLGPGGRWVAMKGVRPDKEIMALPGGCRVLTVERLNVPLLDAERHAVLIEREGSAA